MGAPSETTPTQSDQAITSVTFNYSDARGIGPEPGVCRRDPSDVIPVGDTYYLVVPHNGSREGSYGTDSSGRERPPAIEACLPQAVGGCR